MRKTEKRKLLLSIFADFLFMIIAIAILISAIFISRSILYPQRSFAGELNIRTEYMPKEYKGELKVGSVLYDTLTKRRVGEIKALEEDENDGKIRFFITLDASFKPRSKSLRSDTLWFYFAECDI